MMRALAVWAGMMFAAGTLAPATPPVSQAWRQADGTMTYRALFSCWDASDSIMTGWVAGAALRPAGVGSMHRRSSAKPPAELLLGVEAPSSWNSCQPAQSLALTSSPCCVFISMGAWLVTASQQPLRAPAVDQEIVLDRVKNLCGDHDDAQA